jgi:hypothetical protein
VPHRTKTAAVGYGYQTAVLPEFDEVFRAVQRTLRQAELP